MIIFYFYFLMNKNLGFTKIRAELLLPWLDFPLSVTFLIKEYVSFFIFIQ